MKSVRAFPVWPKEHVVDKSVEQAEAATLDGRPPEFFGAVQYRLDQYKDSDSKRAVE